VQQAEQHRAPILRVAEAYAKWFTPTILALAALVWVATGEARRAVTILIVGCPCAFVLATPTAVIAALGRASRAGILIKGGKYLEACAKVNVLAFDKTGTLTTGNCRIRDVVTLDGWTTAALLAQAARLEAGAEHPLARAIVQKARDAGVDVAGSANIQREAGLGISELANTGEGVWHIGNQRFMDRRGVSVAAEFRQLAEVSRRAGHTVLFLAEGKALRGLLTVEDEIRPEASRIFADLHASGYDDLRMLTGDGKTAACRVAQKLGIPPQQVLADLLPEQKYKCIESWEQRGRRVCYVGDGTNDGPALAVASVGVSIASRENTVALENAHVVLMRDGLAGLPFLLRLSKATTQTIHQNIILFGLLFNAAMLCLSTLGLLSPILGAVGHNLGSVAVVLNSAKLLRYR
jgi:Zn2+/Cd2+-exporting ATPase